MELDTRYLPSITELTLPVVLRILALSLHPETKGFEVKVKDVHVEGRQALPKQVGSYSISFNDASGKNTYTYTIYAARLPESLDLSEIEYFDGKKDRLISFVNGELEDLEAKKTIVQLANKLKELGSGEPRTSAAAQVA